MNPYNSHRNSRFNGSGGGMQSFQSNISLFVVLAMILSVAHFFHDGGDVNDRKIIIDSSSNISIPSSSKEEIHNVINDQDMQMNNHIATSKDVMLKTDSTENYVKGNNQSFADSDGNADSLMQEKEGKDDGKVASEEIKQSDISVVDKNSFQLDIVTAC